MRSRIDEVKQEVIQYILKNGGRQRVADLAGLHFNTVAELVTGKRDNCSITTLMKIELAINELKERKAKDSWYYAGPKTLKGKDIGDSI